MKTLLLLLFPLGPQSFLFTRQHHLILLLDLALLANSHGVRLRDILLLLLDLLLDALGRLALRPLLDLVGKGPLNLSPTIPVNQSVVIRGCPRPRRYPHATHGTQEVRLVRHATEAGETQLMLARQYNWLHENLKADWTRTVTYAHIKAVVVRRRYAL